MRWRMPRSFALGERFERFIDEKVSSGRFNNASEVVRAALRLLEDQEQERQLELDRLRRDIEEGRRSGPPRPADDVFERLEAKYLELAEKRG
jgi:antitoxin ParD1/3/4